MKGLSKCVCSTPGVEGSSSHDPPPGQLALDLYSNSISEVGVRYLSDMVSALDLSLKREKMDSSTYCERSSLLLLLV